MTTAQPTRSSPMQIAKRVMPILSWMPAYDRRWLRPDIIAALTLWALLVPEAMAYAGIAGMPPETGLYAAPLAMIAYAIFGSARHLNVGPSSAIAALSFSVIGGLALSGSAEFIVLSIALALVVGLMLILAGILRLGVLADFLSRPVLDGFVVGVAISIAVGQLDKILGFEPEGYDFIPDVIQFVGDIGNTHLPTLVVGGTSLALLFILHRVAPKLPSALIVLFLAIGLSALLDFAGMGIHIVGEIPAGLPDFGFPEELGLDDLVAVIPGAAGVALVAFAESVAIARAYGTKYGYEVDANQELIAVGVANLGSSFSGAFVVDGSMSRTAASESSGGQSQMVSLIAAVAILITAVALTPLFFSLPEATLGAIVIHAVWKNINFSRVSKYLRITKLDFATALVAMLGVLALGLLEGLLLAMFLGLLVLLFGTKRRNTTILGKESGSDIYRSIENAPSAETIPGLLILRFDGTLFFANTHDFVVAARDALETTAPSPQVLLLDCESINGIDATAVFTLVEFYDQLERDGVTLRLARVKTHVLEVMERGGLVDAIGANHIYPSVQLGADAFLNESNASD